MNFQDLKSIEDYKFYLDVAFGRAKKKASDNSHKKNRDPLNTAKDKELVRIDCVESYLTSTLSLIEKSFPSIDALPNFYYELCNLNFNSDDLKKALSSLPWAASKISELARETKRRIKLSKTPDAAKKYRNAFYGRTDSIMKKISKKLLEIENARRIMKSFPAVKQGIFTVAFVGFPNVGKSTLICNLTGSDIEINSYSFTTKRLLVGYMKKNHKKVQLIDTPGTLNRDDKKNDIEKQAELAMEHAAHSMVYVFDPTEQYPLHKQEKLLKKTIKEHKKNIIIYISKTDIADPIIVDEIKEKHKDAITKKNILIEKIWQESEIFEKNNNHDIKAYLQNLEKEQSHNK